MKKILLCTLGLLSILYLSIPAFAADASEWQIDPALMYLMTQSGSGSSQTTTTDFLGDLGIGYKFDSPLFIGGLLDYDTTATNPNGTTNTYMNYGATIGLDTDNFYLNFTYFFSTQDQVSGSGNSTTYTGTNGFQVSIGYLFPVGSWSVGPQLSYRSLTFSTAGATTPYNTFRPYIAFQFHI